MLSWMAWTTPTAVFFLSIGMILIVMTLWEIRRPTIERKGFLPIATTRGDRLFIGLLSSAFIHLGVIGLSDIGLWWALGSAVVLMIVLMRWG